MAQSQTDIQRKNDTMSDIQRVRSQVEDGLTMGDAMFGRFAHADVAREVTRRTEELQMKKEKLEQDLKEKEAIIQKANRDFSDVKDALPETQERQRIKFVEDYTLLFLTLSYVFMGISLIVFYVSVSEQKTTAVMTALGYSVLVTLMMGIILYFIA
jgi:chromosome segregation ATPase